MLTVNIICIGKLKESYLREACAEYQKRMGAFCKLNLVELAECKLPPAPSESEIAHCIEVEGEAILAKLKGFTMPLCIEGKLLSSEDLAAKLSALMTSGVSEVSCIIGGSYGLSDRIKLQSGLRLSMSPMTFPHQLARVMLLEQLYRCFQINANGKYHK